MTSELKRGPIQKFIRADLQERGSLLSVSCTGLRADDSPDQAGAEIWDIERKTVK